MRFLNIVNDIDSVEEARWHVEQRQMQERKPFPARIFVLPYLHHSAGETVDDIDSLQRVVADGIRASRDLGGEGKVRVYWPD